MPHAWAGTGRAVLAGAGRSGRRRHLELDALTAADAGQRLSEPVQGALDGAVAMVEELVLRARAGVEVA